MPKKRIAICVPSTDEWKADFGLSLTRMVAHWATTWGGETGEKDAEYGVHNVRTSILPSARNMMVEWAQETKATHILMLDDDMTFPPELLNMLLRHKEPIVAANCVLREYPTQPTARQEQSRVYTEKGQTGLEEVDSVGTAVMLIDMKVFDKIEKPWFAFAKHPQLVNRCVGEDVWFCKRAKKAGYKILIDHEVSNLVGHIGQQIFVHEMARLSRDRGLLDQAEANRK